MDLKFIQQYSWGKPWVGILHLPEEAILYKYMDCDGFQEWYIFINDSVLTDWKGDGCCQVMGYHLENYIILYLNGVTTDWTSIDEEEFKEFFYNTFHNTFIYRYKQALYEPISSTEDILSTSRIEFKKVQDEQLICCYRIKGLSYHGTLLCTKIILRDRFDLHEELLIDKSIFRLSDLDLTSNKEKIVVNNDESLYKECFDLVTSKLY